jgi:hypothetical protein
LYKYNQSYNFKMFKRGGFASFTKTGRRMQYGAAVGTSLAKGGSNSSESDEESGPLCNVILFIIFIIFVHIIINGIIQIDKQKHLQ